MAFNGTGSNVTSLNAANIASGTVPTARLGSGTANSTTFLRGDQTYATPLSLTGVRGQVFTSSGTFTVPTGVTSVKVTVVGGGGNGGAATATTGRSATRNAGGGGGGGGTAVEYITGLTPGGTVSVTVGGIASTSSFGAFCSATGGATVGTNVKTGGAGGAGSGGNFNYTGSAGAIGVVGAARYGGIGGASGSPSVPNTFNFDSNRDIEKTFRVKNNKWEEAHPTVTQHAIWLLGLKERMGDDPLLCQEQLDLIKLVEELKTSTKTFKEFEDSLKGTEWFIKRQYRGF
jgi:hypothetical protein